MKKPRSDSKLKTLPPHQREALIRWLAEENLSYLDAKKRLHEDFNVKTSIGALANFYATCCWQRSSSHAREIADMVAAAAKGTNEAYDDATLALIKERAFILARTQNSDTKELTRLASILGESAKLRIKERDLALKERRLALLEKKAKQADEASGVMHDKTLTDEQRAKRMRQIFRMS